MLGSPICAPIARPCHRRLRPAKGATHGFACASALVSLSVDCDSKSLLERGVGRDSFSARRRIVPRVDRIVVGGGDPHHLRLLERREDDPVRGRALFPPRSAPAVRAGACDRSLAACRRKPRSLALTGRLADGWVPSLFWATPARVPRCNGGSTRPQPPLAMIPLQSAGFTTAAARSPAGPHAAS